MEPTSNTYFGTQALNAADLVPKSNFVFCGDKTLICESMKKFRRKEDRRRRENIHQVD